MPAPEPSSSQNKKRLLVVDDEELVGTLLERFLEDHFAVTVTTDPEVALGEIAPGSFDLILTDLRMPKVDGMELLRRARAVAPDIPVVIMSGHIAPEDGVSEITEAGAAGFLRKPFPRKAKLRAYLTGILESQVSRRP